MNEKAEIFLRTVEENRLQCRQHEDQRATITGLVVVIASAIQGGLTQTGFNKNALPLTIMLIVLGFFGMTASAKLYERAKLHSDRARKLREQLSEIYPDLQLESLIEISNKEHNKKYGLIAQKVRLYIIWLTLHAIIAVLGFIYTIIILIR